MFGTSAFNRNPSNAKLMESRQDSSPLASPFGTANLGTRNSSISLFGSSSSNHSPSVSSFGLTNSGTSFASVLGWSSSGTTSVSSFGPSSNGTPSISPFGSLSNGAPSVSSFGSYGNGTLTFSPCGSSGNGTSTFPSFQSSTNGTSTFSPFGSSGSGTSTFSPFGFSSSGTSTFSFFGSSGSGTSTFSPFQSSGSGTSTFPPLGSSANITSTFSPFGSSGSGTSALSPFGSSGSGTSTFSPFGSSGNGTSCVSPFGPSTNGTAPVLASGLLPSNGTPISPFGLSGSGTPVWPFGLFNCGTLSDSPFGPSAIGNSGFSNANHGSTSQQTHFVFSQPKQAYSPTSVEDKDNKGNISTLWMQSMCCMPIYKDKSHEELRLENYQAKGEVKNTKQTTGGFGPIISTPPPTLVTPTSNTTGPSPNFWQYLPTIQTQNPSPNTLQKQLTTQTQNPSPHNQLASQKKTAGLFNLNNPPVPDNSTTNTFPSKNPFTFNPVTIQNSVFTSQISPCPPAPEILLNPNFYSNGTMNLANVPSTNPSVQQNMTNSPPAGGDTTGTTEAVSQLCTKPFGTPKVLQPSVDCQRSIVSNQYGISSRPVLKCVLN